MKAVRYNTYGPPEVLTLEEIEKPTPKENEVLIKIHSASVNPLDWHYMRGSPYLMRLSEGFKPKYKTLGADLAGRVEAVGSKVKQFKPGDEVFGDSFSNGLGAFAEYICMTEDSIVITKPANATFEEAAAIPVAAITALQSLRNSAKVQQGQRVLINGASGGVGTFAVQIAKSYGAEVTAICSTRNVELVKSIGADHVIDYTKEDFAGCGKTFDLLIDNVGNRTVSDYRKVLTPNGKCVIVGYTSPALLVHHMFRAPLSSLFASNKVGVMPTAKPNKPDLIFLKELVESGKLKAVIDKRYPLSETAEAIRYVEQGHARGKVIITMPS